MLALALAAPSLPPLGLRERWSLALTEGSAAGTLPHTVVVGDRAFYTEQHWGDATGFGCVDLATGRRLWWRPVRSGSEGSVMANAAHFVGLTGDAVSDIDPKTGHARWQGRRVGFPGGAALAGDRLVYAPKDRTLVGVDLARGREIWRKTFPVGLMAGYGHTLTDRGLAVFPGDDGSVFGVSVADGRTRWRTPTGQGKNLFLRPMGESTLVVGDGLTALRTADGRTLWSRKDQPGQEAAYLPRLRQIWTLALDGRLSRISAADGRTLGDAMLPGVTEGALEVAKPYAGATLLATRGPLLRLDDAGRATAAFDPQESVFELIPMGRDVMLRTDKRLVRLTPGTAPAVGDLSTILAKPALTPGERRAVVAQGGKAVPTLITAAEAASGTRREALAELLAATAGPQESLAVLDLAERWGLFRLATGRAIGTVARWLDEKGDRETLADAALAKYRAAGGAGYGGPYLPMFARGTHQAVVDELLRLLRDLATPVMWQSVVYAHVGASGRADALSAIRAIRGEGRRLALPTEGLSATADADGDGLPDAVDANPFVAPRALGEREKVLAAAFDALYRFDPTSEGIGLVRYPVGMRPFELVGWRGVLAPLERASALGVEPGRREKGSKRYSVLDLASHGHGTSGVEFGPDGRTATVEIGQFLGGAGGWGTTVNLRKFGGEWFAADVQEAWIT